MNPETTHADRPSETVREAVAFHPASGRVLARYPWMDSSQVEAAFKRARQAQPDWQQLDPRERARRLRPLAARLEAEADRLAAEIARCTGKPELEAISTEILPAAIATRYYCRMAPRWLRPRRPRRSSVGFLHKRSRIHRIPHGLVSLITPWNYPLGIPAHEILCALLAGNAVVFKSSPETVPVGESLTDLFRERLPEGLLQHLIMPGPDAGARFLRPDDGVDRLGFTGSVAVGQHLARQAAETLTPVSMELGGKDAMLVCPDAPLERAVQGALWGGMQNAGQACAGIERIYVHADIHERFRDRLAESIAGLRVGPPDRPDTDVGPLCSSRQRDRVQSQLDQALEEGARILARAEPGPEADPSGYYLAPTLLGQLNDDMAILREECFGPLLLLCPVRDMDEAVRRANDSDYGLTASVWTRSRRQGQALAARLRVGSVTLNDHLVTHGMAELPWHGLRSSGLGVTHGQSGLESMTLEQNRVADRLARTPRALWWYPYGQGLRRGLRGLLTLFHGRGIGRRLGGAGHLLRQLPRIFHGNRS